MCKNVKKPTATVRIKNKGERALFSDIRLLLYHLIRLGQNENIYHYPHQDTMRVEFCWFH